MVRIIDKSNTVNDQVASGYMNQGLLIPGICLVMSISRIVNDSPACQGKTVLSSKMILVSELYRGARSYIYRLVPRECEFLSGDCAQVALLKLSTVLISTGTLTCLPFSTTSKVPLGAGS